MAIEHHSLVECIEYNNKFRAGITFEGQASNLNSKGKCLKGIQKHVPYIFNINAG